MITAKEMRNITEWSKKDLDWFGNFKQSSEEGLNHYWVNTVVIPDEILKNFVELGYNVFKREPFISVTGYPLTLITWAEESDIKNIPHFDAYTLIEFNG